MKQTMKLILMAFLVCLISSCSGEKKPADSENPSEEPGTATTAEVTESPAVCVYWAGLSLRAEPNKDAKYLTAIKLGEKVTSLGLVAVDSSDKNREYIKVRLMDGKEGWSQSGFIVVNAEPAVLIKDAEIYSRPDLVTKSNKVFSKMDVIAVMQSQDEWIEVKGKRKEGSYTETGWIKPINISYESTDIAVAIFTRQAMAKKSDADKITALEDIIRNSDLSQSELIPVVISQLEELQGSAEEVPEPE